ncbi:tail fiber domain-containing protein [Octadecabacter ascidiaceicola]|uniref:Peptidase S74 domain-containing protein n=1 Tax=Octadecabacter ascidiaceicola TaxID=1655543 RepID=A0A238JLX1_9RHOB|nr:tail fiber domain-containing protein [Octadecabacter ascidiaceicola]SMX31678.1 hypothetical protein OCA8868_00485 [Octadecabacter ascidiaceicola]
MKNSFFALALSGAIASPSFAGGLADPIIAMAPTEVEIESQASSSSNLIIPLVLIALIVAASSGSDAAVFGPSDARIKTDIQPVGMSPSGLPIYHYSYIGSSVVFEGVMAQDVLMHTPAAVITYPSGLMAVNYDMLGIEFKVVD